MVEMGLNFEQVGEMGVENDFVIGEYRQISNYLRKVVVMQVQDAIVVYNDHIRRKFANLLEKNSLEEKHDVLGSSSERTGGVLVYLMLFGEESPKVGRVEGET